MGEEDMAALCSSLLDLLKSTSNLPSELNPSDLSYLLESNIDILKWVEWVCDHVHEENWLSIRELDIFERLVRENRVLRGGPLHDALHTLTKSSVSESESPSMSSLSSDVSLLKVFESQTAGVANSLNAHLATQIFNSGQQTSVIEKRKKQLNSYKAKVDESERKEVNLAIQVLHEAFEEIGEALTQSSSTKEPPRIRGSLLNESPDVLGKLCGEDELFLKKLCDLTDVSLLSSREGDNILNEQTQLHLASLVPVQQVLEEGYVRMLSEVEALKQLLSFAQKAHDYEKMGDVEESEEQLSLDLLRTLKPKVHNMGEILANYASNYGHTEVKKALVCIAKEELRKEVDKEQVESRISSLLLDQRSQQSVLELLLRREYEILANVGSILDEISEWIDVSNSNTLGNNGRDEVHANLDEQESDRLFEELLQSLCNCQDFMPTGKLLFVTTGSDDQIAYVAGLVKDVEALQFQKVDNEKTRDKALKKLEKSKQQLASTLDLDSSRRYCVSHVDVFEGLQRVRDASKSFESQLREEESKWDGMRNQLKSDPLKSMQQRLWIDFLVRPKLMEANVEAMEKKARIASHTQ